MRGPGKNPASCRSTFAGKDLCDWHALSDHMRFEVSINQGTLLGRMEVKKGATSVLDIRPLGPVIRGPLRQ